MKKGQIYMLEELPYLGNFKKWLEISLARYVTS